MKKIFFFIVFQLFFSYVFAQFTVDIEFLPTNQEVLNQCIDENISMQAVVNHSGTFDASKARFTWYLGDDTQQSDLNLLLINHSYAKAGGYYILLKVEDEFGTVEFARKKVQIGLTPKFDQTTVNTDKPICKGDRVMLSAKILENSWKYIFKNKQVLQPTYQIADNYPQYARSITFFSFIEDELITDLSQIKNIFAKLEHSAQSDLQIKMKCPNGTEVVLKDFGGNASKLGTPLLDPVIGEGTGFVYQWADVALFSDMNTESLTNTTLQAGAYASQQNLSAFIGCPINGEWTFTIVDNQSTNNGYLFEWGIEFDAALQDTEWQFSNTYNKNTATWSGVGVGLPTNLTEGNAFTSTVFGTPQDYGSTLYTFSVENDFGCTCDTAINVQVTQPNFTFTPQTGEAPIEITFENLTLWGKDFLWNFGLENKESIEENPVFEYTADSDTSYKILLKVTSETGCWDTVSQKIYITVPNSDIDLPNVFTPNDDGNNDIWYIKPKAQDKDLQDIITEIDCRIYNRDGRMVCRFRTPEEAQKGWDGSTSNNGGAKVSEGIYFYTIKIKGKDGKELEKEFQRGFIHVFK